MISDSLLLRFSFNLLVFGCFIIVISFLSLYEKALKENELSSFSSVFNWRLVSGCSQAVFGVLLVVLSLFLMIISFGDAEQVVIQSRFISFLLFGYQLSFSFFLYVGFKIKNKVSGDYLYKYIYRAVFDGPPWVQVKFTALSVFAFVLYVADSDFFIKGMDI